MTRLTSFLALFGSVGTLFCCALPSLLVMLGMGAVFAGMIERFPQMVWLSEHKFAVLVFAGVILTVAGVAQWKSRQLNCPTESELATACRQSRDWSLKVYMASLLIYLIGAGFNIAGLIMESFYEKF